MREEAAVVGDARVGVPEHPLELARLERLQGL
jgi:hypothetical protein